jgi:hypothetical protein
METPQQIPFVWVDDFHIARGLLLVKSSDAARLDMFRRLPDLAWHLPCPLSVQRWIYPCQPSDVHATAFITPPMAIKLFARREKSEDVFWLATQ